MITSSADIIQAIQAIKESKSRPSELKALLYELLQALADSNAYCTESNLSLVYDRAQTQVVDAIKLLYPSVHLNGYDKQTSSEDRLVVNFTGEDIANLKGVETVELGKKLIVPRMFNGFWQMSSPAWGSASATKVDDALLDLVKHGLVASDMADHYVGP